MRHRGLGVAVVVALAASGAHAQPAVSLQAAVEMAVARHPAVTAARQALEAARARLAQIRAGRAPQVAVVVESAYGTTRAAPSAPTWTATGEVRASLELVNLLVRYQVEQAEAAVRAAEAAVQQARQDVALAAAQAYFAVLRARAVVTAREAAVERAGAQVRQAEAQAAAGVAARADVLQARAALAAAEVDLIAARNQVDTAVAQLRSAVGVPLTEPVEVAPSEPPSVPVLTREEAVARSGDRPDVRRAECDVEAARAALALAEAQARPAVVVAATSSAGLLNGSPLTWQVAATVSYPLVDGGRAQAAVVEARANLAAAQARLAQARQAAELDALTAWVALADARARVDAARVSEAAAGEALRAAEGRYQAGVGTIVEVLAARATFQSAVLARIQAEFDVQAAAARLRHAIGRPVVGGEP
ncbi:MAG: TolC family protein [Armatimonadota bacterium]|nr:TolC family protein [Armatimonadota bacterium]MDR7404458.1 TolC family protein [Armatimonadota bacterium]MDR7510198.1 TolC family protein [Armatimonadota bacterium]MDR7561870.1 TolC family protein [Armatimonadota bacterium]MDR7587707.1 TolC family protein [Armatimonadota bacterium]